MDSWQPDQQRLRELTFLLRDATNPNCQDQGLLNQRLQLFDENPYYNTYLMYILTKSNDQDINIRVVAGQRLQNNIKNNFNSISLFALNYIKQACIQYLTYPDASPISKIVSSIMSLIVGRGQVHNWLDALYFLIHQLDSKDALTVEIALDTLVIICEDTAREIDQEINSIRPLNFMLPKLVGLVSNPNPKWRAKAIHIIRQFISLQSLSFLQQFDTVLMALYSRISDRDTHVRQELGPAFAFLWQTFPERLKVYLYPTIEYMIEAMMDQDETVALGACDFWIEYAHIHLYHNELVPYLPRLVNCLLKRMIYSEEWVQDVYTNRTESQYYHSENLIESPRDYLEFELHNTDGEHEEDDEDFDDDEFYSQISLRETSAGTLEVLSIAFGIKLVSALLNQLLNHTLCDQNWLVRESGILALGAAAEGGIEVISRYLNHLIPYLLNSLEDPQPLIRATSCWVISRFSKWLVIQYDTNKEGREVYFEPVLSALLNRLLDENKQVQLSACTAITTMEESASQRIVSYIYSILLQTNRAFALYHRKNRLILYDALGTLADSAKSALNNATYIHLLMPPLITKWNELADNDTDLYPLLECLSPITAALGPGFKPFVEPVLSRCVQLISNTLQLQACIDDFPESMDPPNVKFLIAALDLLSGIVRGLGPSVRPLISKTNPPLIPLLTACIHDPVSEVLQSAFMLIGDIAVACFDLLEPFVPDILEGLIHAIEDTECTTSVVSVYNNAVWAIGEIVMRWKLKTNHYVPALVGVLIPLLEHIHSEDKVRENSMITLGRMGLAWPEYVAPYLKRFIKPWLNKSLSVREGDEKDSAFRGFCAIIKLNIQEARDELYLLLVAISDWESPSSLLLNDLHDVVKKFHQITDKDEWDCIFSLLDKQAQLYIRNFLEK
ncbi:hypothetical protein G6F46_000923 [Rhizopus delemar]|uniref:Importin N-terminal domain-containing protein n=2 Tax=Rhizopus TaxID=4842 RepID=A0A9P6ZD48_9FUNG|nr:hypothetical protein G6F55_000432 [Rhizopus delemar]KAG1552631.1 hypothetical protein G6F51_001098 [Rhizopus arrhizus]KAG1504528.1 hypothetical protein G6F54_000937 [Rhizopus delemar]KAG1518239.1 hypothetical protein G6F53_000745 [Rhizopus delemar]KAG1562340.1 hypothetical protein G6F49_001003 [Rhizopus delemar]